MPRNLLGLPPPDPKYYRQDGADVRVEDGGTAASDAGTARRNLDVPGRSADETISGSWTFVGTTNLGATTVKDADFTIVDDADGTKKAKFECSGITAGQTRTLTVPNRSSTIATLDGAQTFTGTGAFTAYPTALRVGEANVTTGSIVFANSANNFVVDLQTPVVGGSRTVTLPNQTTTLIGTDTVDVLTGKSLSDSTCKVVNVSDTTKVAKFSFGGATTGKTLTLAWSGTLNRTVTFPNATTTLAGLGVAQTFTADQTFGTAYATNFVGTGNSFFLQNGDVELTVADLTGGEVRFVASGRVPAVQNPVALTGQTADKATTDFIVAGTAYRLLVTAYLQVTAAGSGTLTLTLGWTDNVGATTDATHTLTLGSTGRAQKSFVIHSTGSAAVTYAVGMGGGSGTWALHLDYVVLKKG